MIGLGEVEMAVEDMVTTSFELVLVTITVVLPEAVKADRIG